MVHMFKIEGASTSILKLDTRGIILITNHPPEELVQNPHIFDTQLPIEQMYLI